MYVSLTFSEDPSAEKVSDTYIKDIITFFFRIRFYGFWRFSNFSRGKFQHFFYV